MGNEDESRGDKFTPLCRAALCIAAGVCITERNKWWKCWKSLVLHLSALQKAVLVMAEQRPAS